MPRSTELDDFDRAILRELQQDAALTNVELAERIGLSSSPCWRRIQRLETLGVIVRRVALVDPEAVGQSTFVFATVKLEKHSEDALRQFEKEIVGLPQILECYSVSGDVDYLLRIVTSDVRSYETFLRKHLLNLPMVAEVQSRIVITQVKHTTALPLEDP